MANERRLVDVELAKAALMGFDIDQNIEMFETLDSLPTVEAVEVVHGRWVRYTDEYFVGYDAKGRIKYRKRYCYECTCCGENKLTKTNFCPNCGAKMDGGNEK